MFPIEIWELIFNVTDPVDLSRFKSVCSSWNNCITNILKTSDLWYKKCLRDIPESDRSIILEKLLPDTNGIDLAYLATDGKTWMTMYKSWIKWENLQDYMLSVKSIEYLPAESNEKITCITASRNLLAIGSNEGYIRFYNLNKSKTTPIFIADQTESVSDIKFIENDEFIVAVTGSFQGRVYFWNIDLQELICKKPGDLISSSHGYCYILKRNVLLVDGLVTSTVYEFDYTKPKYVALAADKHQIFLWSEIGHHIKMSLNDGIWSKSCFYVEPPTTGRLMQFKLFKSGIAVCLCVDGYLRISVDCNQWITYNVFAYLHGLPKSVYYYSRILMLGLDTGDVYMYPIRNPSELQNISFNSPKARKIELCTDPIISLDIMERKHNQYLIAASSKYVFITKFN